MGTLRLEFCKEGSGKVDAVELALYVRVPVPWTLSRLSSASYGPQHRLKPAGTREGARGRAGPPTAHADEPRPPGSTAVFEDSPNKAPYRTLWKGYGRRVAVGRPCFRRVSPEALALSLRFLPAPGAQAAGKQDTVVQGGAAGWSKAGAQDGCDVPGKQDCRGQKDQLEEERPGMQGRPGSRAGPAQLEGRPQGPPGSRRRETAAT